MAEPCLVVLVTCPTGRPAATLAGALVERRLAACVNIVPTVTSIFRWQGKIDRAREALLVVKTTTRGFEALRRAVLDLHPYESPEIIALPINQAHEPYLAWVRSNVSASSPPKRAK